MSGLMILQSINTLKAKIKIYIKTLNNSMLNYFQTIFVQYHVSAMWQSVIRIVLSLIRSFFFKPNDFVGNKINIIHMDNVKKIQQIGLS